MTTVGRVAEIWRYPVKSMAGERLDRVGVASRGLPGDRAWAVRDEVRGGIRGAKKIPGLMKLRARYPETPAEEGSTPAEILLPDGGRCLSTDDDVAARLSDALGHQVTLWPLLPASAVEHYRRGVPSHPELETELRAIFARTAGEPLPDLSQFPRELMEFESPPGTYFDAYPILLLSEASLRSVADAAPASRIDVRRFRPNFLVETGDESGFPENAWSGGRLRLGEAVLALTLCCPRCVMTTLGFDDLPADPDIMRTLVREAGGRLGVYATVAEPGAVRVGDAVELLDAPG